MLPLKPMLLLFLISYFLFLISYFFYSFLINFFSFFFFLSSLFFVLSSLFSSLLLVGWLAPVPGFGSQNKKRGRKERHPRLIFLWVGDIGVLQCHEWEM